MYVPAENFKPSLMDLDTQKGGIWFWSQIEELSVQVETLDKAGNTKGGSITVLSTSCLTGLDKSVL
jgi:hypothetical protein